MSRSLFPKVQGVLTPIAKTLLRLCRVSVPCKGQFTSVLYTTFLGLPDSSIGIVSI